MSGQADASTRTLFVAIAGNPNSGKTSVFNCLTGQRRKVANYPGVTVERIEGPLTLPDETRARLVDLPGTYSLVARSEDERIARNVVLGLVPETPRPDVAICVVDASNLERNLYLTTQLMETGLPVCVALNMTDVATKAGLEIDAPALEEALEVPVVEVNGKTGAGMQALRAAVLEARAPGRRWRLADSQEQILAAVREAVLTADLVPADAADGEALRLVTSARPDDPFLTRGGPAVSAAVADARRRLQEDGIDHQALEAECRYELCRSFAERATSVREEVRSSPTERIDRVVTHRVFGPLVFLGLMALMFQAVYSWGAPFMDWIEAGTGWLGAGAARLLGPGMLTDLIADGIIAGVGNIVIFLPQICLLFLFITILEDVGYLARAAFLIGRVMRGVGLHGRSFIPLMSSFACAIPGIMATRTIENRRERLVTILVAPLMSCSARLPVYTLMIGAFIPAGYQGLTLFGMYALSIASGLIVAWVLRKTLLRGKSAPFIMELPSYKLPALRHVVAIVLSRGWVFVRQAGTIILAISVILWALAYFPRSEEVAAQAERRIAQGEPAEEVEKWQSSAQIGQSYAGRLGRTMEPVLEPLGFDWKIGIGVIASFAAREVLVSTLGVVYSVGEADETSVALRDKLKNAKRPDGSPSFTWLTALSLMVFFVLACQCMSTLAVVKRETNSWRWPVFMFGYMTALAYVASLIVYQGGLALGFGT